MSSSVSKQQTASKFWQYLTSSVLLRFVVLLLIAAYFSPHIWQHGEAREALVVQDILHQHRWILPLRNDQLPSKPVLYHWIGASSAMVLGQSDFTMRLPSIFGALLMVWFTYLIGVRVGNFTTGLLAAGILGTTFEFWDSATEARVDMLFASLVGLSLTGWYIWHRSGAEFGRAMAYIGIASAVLTKGPAGAVLPLIVIVSFVVLEHDPAKLLAFLSYRWILVVLIVDIGWYVAAYEMRGADFWNKQIIHENVERFIGQGDFQTKRGNLSQGVWFITQLFPWSVVLVISFIQWIRGLRSEPIYRFLHIWWLSILVFFLIATGQRAVYLLPIYPAVALLTARELQRWMDVSGVRATRLFRLYPKIAAGAAIAMLDVVFALAVPISRTVQEDSSAQEEFVDDVIANVAPLSRLYAAPDFPETTLMVLAYRLDRRIARYRPKCDWDYYYLTSGRTAPKYLTEPFQPIAADRNKTLYLSRKMSARTNCSPTGQPLREGDD